MTAVHLIVVGVYLAGILAMSLYFMRQKDTDDFFVANRSLGWFPVALSVMASNFSAISLMGLPGFIYKTSLQTTLALLIALPLVTGPVIFLFLRFFQGRKLVSAYEYLEARFHVSLRLIGASIFVLLRMTWLATVLYVPSLAISTVTGMSLAGCVITVGILTTVYTAAGGMRAVVWTDVVQFFVMLIGLAGMAIVIMGKFGWDFSALWAVAESAGRTRMIDPVFNMKEDLSFWGLLAGYTFINLSSHGADQLVVQRYLSTRNFREGARSAVGVVAATLPVMAILAFLGIGMYAFYNVTGTTPPDFLNPANVDLLDAAGKSVYNPDGVLPHFIMTQLSPVIGGLMLAAVLSATMSSVDSGLNSMSCICVIDFAKRLRKPASGSDEKAMLRLARVSTFFWGIVGTVGALFVDRLGTILEISIKTNSFFTGVLLGLFLLGVLFRRANALGGAAGTILGMTTVVAIGLGSDISYWWYSPIGCCATLFFGFVASFLAAPPCSVQTAGLTIMSRENQN